MGFSCLRRAWYEKKIKAENGFIKMGGFTQNGLKNLGDLGVVQLADIVENQQSIWRMIS